MDPFPTALLQLTIVSRQYLPFNLPDSIQVGTQVPGLLRSKSGLGRTGRWRVGDKRTAERLPQVPTSVPRCVEVEAGGVPRAPQKVGGSQSMRPIGEAYRFTRKSSHIWPSALCNLSFSPQSSSHYHNIVYANLLRRKKRIQY